MKVKMKLDMDKVKEFGIEHGEKFGLALAVLILGVFIVKAASRETLPEKLQASQIESRSQQADQKIKSLPAPPKAQDVSNIDFVNLIATEPASVPPGVDIPDLHHPPFPDLIKRVDPTLFAVEELEAHSFRGGLVVTPRDEQRMAPPPARMPVAGPATGLVPARTPAPRTGLRVGTGAADRQGARTPAPVGLIPAGLGQGGAQGAVPIPADFHPPGPQSTGFAEGHYGIVITGLIPEQAQREEYDRRFKNARRGSMAEGPNGPSRGRDRGSADLDVPQYVWCFLERTDTTAGQTTLLDFGDAEEVRHALQLTDPELRDATKALVKKLALSPAVGNRLVAAEHNWGAAPSEVVDPGYLMEKWFSWPLPPILLRVWGAEAAHPPKIPLFVAAAPAGAATGAQANPAAQGSGFDDPATPAGPNQTSPPMSRRFRGGGVGPFPQQPQAQGQGQAAEVPYKLFRFVDLDVEPGHAYQYRVRMLLRNPNFALEPQVLLKPETATVAFKETPWSEKSSAVAIQPDMRLLGGAIDRPKRMEPKAKVGVFVFDKAQAIELIKEFETELGALVGTTVADQVVKSVADPVKKEMRDITGEFRTASVLLDFRGNDEKLPGAGNLTDPAEMLLLDDIDHPETARLIVVNEAKDAQTIDDWKKTHIPPAAPASDVPLPGAKAPANAVKPNTGLLPNSGLLPNRSGARRPATR